MNDDDKTPVRKTQRLARPGAVVPAEKGEVAPPHDAHDHSPMEDAEERLKDAAHSLEEKTAPRGSDEE